jgi:hypothetical protein
VLLSRTGSKIKNIKVRTQSCRISQGQLFPPGCERSWKKVCQTVEVCEKSALGSTYLRKLVTTAISLRFTAPWIATSELEKQTQGKVISVISQVVHCIPAQRKKSKRRTAGMSAQRQGQSRTNIRPVSLKTSCCPEWQGDRDRQPTEPSLTRSVP